MSNLNDNSKVIDLQQRQANQAAGTDRLGDLLKSVRATALKRINGLVSSLFENIDDALFDLAEKAENNSVQTQYFDGMREVRKKRQLVERLFQEQLSKIFNDFATGKLQPLTPDAGTPSQTAGMALLEDHELEESLAVASMVAKAENRLARSLYAVNQRLSMISGGSKVEDASNPIGPAPLCHAFRHAVHEFGVIVQVKLIIYKLFDRYVMGGLDPLYDEVNAQLIHAGVLPQMRASAPSPSRAPAPTGGASAYAPNAGQPPLSNNDAPIGQYAGYASYDPASAQLQNEIYHTLRGLLATRRASANVNANIDPSDYSNSGAMVPSFSPTELLNALTILQDQTMMAQTHANTAADAVHQVQQIKTELLDQVSKFSGETKTHVSGADEDTIDLVGMLFEFILQDRNLPAEMQALLARLQIPFLKVAILDKHLFAQKAHPARQLLDSLALASVGWSEESDRDHRLRDKIKQVVETLLKEFDDDLGVFERTHKDFNAFVDAHKKRAELAEQRAAEATRGREKLHAARRIAAREILKRIEGRQLPQIVQNVLSRPWANYLVLTLLRQGEDSTEWKSALQFADEFVWSADTELSDEDKIRLTSVLPSLEKSLRHGLITVAYHENDVKQVMQELRSFYQHVLKGDLPKPDPAINSAVGSEPDTNVYRAATSPVEDMVMAHEEEIDTLSDADYSPDDAFLKLAKEMTVGTWVEFTDTSAGSKERAKLSWISPISAKYLFVNRKGLKVSDKTVFALATELRQGSAVILEEVPLFDRALDAIVERLKSAHSSNTTIQA